MKTVLILDDELNLAKSLASEFKDHGYEPTIVHSIKEIPATEFQFALVDLRLRGEFGLDAIQVIKTNSPLCKIVVLSGYGSIATAVEAVKLGATDYLTKPASFDLIEAALEGRLKKPEPDFKPQSLSQVEHEHIDFVLTKNQGNITKTAKDLGLHRQSLQRKLKKYT
ncbi:MAG: response regulator [Bdellovibrionales bacterium]|nr:response regulator [Bdellovibrionales bacterium]